MQTGNGKRHDGRLHNIARLFLNLFRDSRKAFPVEGKKKIQEEELLRREIPADIKTVIDIGAHVGEFASFARQILPRARIFSIEPYPPAYKILSERFRNDTLFTAICSAAGQDSAELPLQVSGFSPANSLLRPVIAQKIYFPYITGWSSLTVPVRPLDSIINAQEITGPILLKIDVQGYEDRVLKGASGILSQTSMVILEISYVPLYKQQASPDAIRALLQAAGFREQKTLGDIKGLFGGRTLQKNCIFIKHC